MSPKQCCKREVSNIISWIRFEPKTRFRIETVSNDMLVDRRLPDVHEGSKDPAESTNQSMLKIFGSGILVLSLLLSNIQNTLSPSE